MVDSRHARDPYNDAKEGLLLTQVVRQQPAKMRLIFYPMDSKPVDHLLVAEPMRLAMVTSSPHLLNIQQAGTVFRPLLLARI
jgi:hypothetical protein